MDHLDENSLNKPVSDIVKEFKANGNFDQFRKDCFSEITSQSSFHALSKNVEDLVQKYLKEQSHSLRKNDMRDLLRRKLNESYFLNNGISVLINQVIDSKIETNFKPIIENMVNSLSTNHNELLSEPSISSAKSEIQPLSSTTIQESKAPKAQTVSIEDFLSSEKQQVIQKAKIEKAKSITSSASSGSISNVPTCNSISTSTTTVSNITLESKTKKDLNKSETLQNKLADAKKSPKLTASSKPKTANIQVPRKPLNDFEFLKNPALVNDSPLEKDPKNIFNFDWKISTNVSSTKKLCLDDTNASISNNNSSANTSKDLLNDSNETLDNTSKMDS